MKKKKAELAALGEWTHINCLRPDARDAIKDDILRRLIYTPPLTESQSAKAEANASVGRSESILDAVDISKVLEMDVPPLTVQDVPGGTLSFLFERSSVSTLGDEDVEE